MLQRNPGEKFLARGNAAGPALVWWATLGALVLLAAVLAYWTWTWFSPRPAPMVLSVKAQHQLKAAYDAFGGAAQGRNAVALAGPAIRLLGVVAASGGRGGYAIVQFEDKKIIAVREGINVAPGIRLAEVQAEQVVIERDGVRETLALPHNNRDARETFPVPRSGGASPAPAARAGRD
jgi:general secretion pathway protein C